MNTLPRLQLPRLARRARKLATAAAVGVTLTLLAACGTPGADLSPLPPREPMAYQLGVGDQLRVTVFNDPRLTGEFRITDTGAIALPLVGAIPAVGRSTTQLERSVEAALKARNLFNDPAVAIEVSEYRPVFVLGMVERGGQTPYQPGMSVLSAVAISGGFNYRAVTDRVSITRIDADGKAREYLGDRQSLLLPGDVVNVYERGL
ncbi:exopolysaccharide biosynthesis protein [Pseudoroseomonas deserti]|uniref:Exopolysaccharide biosynthesis protein n=1 Tax=Teichococcus deserti TaxID=1817963 RepID=A0A1V2HAI9_9PROT|nr:polysaccharide biosynthesis/export family protein [Pseudoroseomonas deserti]ONG58956.1 exopolysaccharide biosynthesis protein [Pseudoroseomonas deserti]